MAVCQCSNVSRETEDSFVGICTDSRPEQTHWGSPHHAAAPLACVARNLRCSEVFRSPECGQTGVARSATNVQRL